MKPRFSAALSILGYLFLAGSAAFAQATALVPVPPLGPAQALSLPTVSQSALPNGLRIMVVEDHRQPAIYLRLVVPAGIIREPPGKAGLAAVTADLLEASTTTQTFAEIAEKVDKSGASLHIRAEPDDASLSIFGIATQAGEFCDLLADMAQHPKFEEEGLARYKQVLPSAIDGELADPATLAKAALERVIYGSSSYGNFASGTLSTIESLTREDLLAFYERNFSPSTSVLFFVGDITDSAARAMALKAFGGWTAKPSVASAPAASPVAAASAISAASAAAIPGDAKPTIVILDRPGSKQTEVQIGVRTSGYGDSQRIAGDVATAVLGGGQFESRLTHEIRVTRGLTYGVASSIDRNRDAGIFAIKTFTKNESTGEVVRLALAEVHKLAASPPSAAELSDHKTYLDGNFAVSVASTNGFLGNLLEAVLDGDGPSALAQYTGKVDAVTGDEVSKVIASLHIESAHIILVGDARAIEAQVRDIGPVTVIESNDLDLMSPNLRRAGTTL